MLALKSLHPNIPSWLLEAWFGHLLLLVPDGLAYTPLLSKRGSRGASRHVIVAEVSGTPEALSGLAVDARLRAVQLRCNAAMRA